MNHQSLILLIKEYIKRNPQEDVSDLQSLINYIETDPHCFERIKKEGARHIASNMLLFSHDYKNMLCLWHTKIKAWTFPGGHCDGDSDVHAVAQKELLEETGITDIEIADPVPFHIQRFDYRKEVYGYVKSIYAFFFIAPLPDGQQPKIMEPDKCEKMHWFSSEEFTGLTKDDAYNINKSILKKWRNKINDEVVST